MKHWYLLTVATMALAYGTLFSCCVTVAQEPPTTNAVKRTATADVEPLSRVPTGNPFAMRGMGDGEGFIIDSPASIPPGIVVVGILSVGGKKPVCALSIPGSKSLHFVRENDVIRVDRAGTGGAKGATDSQLYLLVKSITHDQIEIAPRTRPQDVRIYR